MTPEQRAALEHTALEVRKRNASVKRGHPKYVASLTSEQEYTLTEGCTRLLQSYSALETRAEELLAWCESRIAICREQERKFAAFRSKRQDPPQALIGAWTERQTLQAVVRRLGGKP